jgi:hypothetical protein
VSTGRVYISRDVVFNEHVFPCTQLHSNVGDQLHAKIHLLPPTLRNSHGYDGVDEHMANGANHGAGECWCVGWCTGRTS